VKARANLRLEERARLRVAQVADYRSVATKRLIGIPGGVRRLPGRFAEGREALQAPLDSRDELWLISVGGSPSCRANLTRSAFIQ